MVLTQRNAAKGDMGPQKASSPGEVAGKAKGNKKVLSQFTMAEVAKHRTVDDGWLVIEGKVYDVTKFVQRHPGGRVIETQLGGRDATDVYTANHVRDRVDRMLPKYLVGELAPGEYQVSDYVKDYRALEAEVAAKGLYVARKSYLVMKTLVCTAIFAAGLYLLAAMPHSKMVLVAAGFCFGIGLQQTALVGHDLGHNSYFDKIKWNDILALVTTSIFGFNADQWKDEHNVHHAITNQVHEDLQFIYLPIWLQDEKELKGIKLPWFARYLIRMQLYTFLPLIVFVGRVNLMALSIVYTLGWDSKRMEWIGPAAPRQFLALGVHYLWQAALLYFMFSDWHERAWFFVTMTTTVGILHVQLMVSHMGTEMFFREEQEDLSYVKFQLHSTRNMWSNWMTHWFHGGLHLQIEHHLFPRLPRHNLETVKPMVEKLCKKHDLPYTTHGFWFAVVDLLKHMNAKAKLV